MKKICKQILQFKYLPYILGFIVILVFHLHVTPSDDDLWFKTQLDNTNLFDYLIYRYYNWTSRIISETFFVLFNRFPIIIWQILDSFICISIPILISKIFNEKGSVKFNWIITMLCFLYPWRDMSTAGWVTTTIAYIWPAAALLFSLWIINELICNRKVPFVIKITGVITSLIAVNMEQSCLLLIGFTFLGLLKLIKEHKFSLKNHKYILLTFMIGLLYLVTILLCPGNDTRSEFETAYWYPAFENFGIISKIYLGIVHTMALILESRIIMIVLSCVLCFIVIREENHAMAKLLSILAACYFILFGILKKIMVILFPMLKKYVEIIFAQSPDQVLLMGNIIIVITVLFVFISMGYLIYISFKQNLLPLFIYLAGLASRVIMGFSPSIFASSSRTAIFMYLGFILLCFMIYEQITKLKISNRYLNMVDSLLIVFMFMNLIYQWHLIY